MLGPTDKQIVGKWWNMTTKEDIFGADLPEKVAQFIKEGERHPALGPNYFFARDVAEQFMSGFEAEHFKPLIEGFAKQFTDSVWTSIVDHFLSDTESNLQHAIWRRVDYCIEALMTGEHWAVEKYALADKYQSGQKVREAVAKHVPREIMDGRIADLEGKVKHLEESLRYARRGLA